LKIQEIYNLLNELSPFSLQEKWDNAGLLVGSFEDEIENIYISIDLDEELVNSVKEQKNIVIFKIY
jgi:putative NIF3 family GTP cyclohydrolase 1 type 2